MEAMNAADLDVLIVDDHDGMRALMRKVLERAGAGAVRDAANGEDALGLLASRPANLVMCDYSMPGMSGVELVRALRADAALSGLRIVMLTGHSSAAIADAARAAGAHAVLVKPVAPSALLAAIAGIMAPAR